MRTDIYVEIMTYNLRKRLQAKALIERAAVLMTEGRTLEAELILAQRDEMLRGTQWKPTLKRESN